MRITRFEQEFACAARPLSTTELAAGGVGRGALRGRRWRCTSRGFHVPADDEPSSTTQRILDVEPQLTDGMAFAGWTAAFVQGVDWFDGFDSRTGEQISIEIASPVIRRRSLTGLRYRVVGLPDSDVQIVHGLPITRPLRTAFDGARWAPSLTEAAVFLDAMLAFGLLDTAQFVDYVREHKGWTGIGQAIESFRLAQGGVRSTWETRLRICYLLEAELPRPMVNVPLFTPGGSFLGIADLFDTDAGLVTEFDGQQHREREQHRLDNIREEGLESANLTVIRSDSLDLQVERRRQLVRRITDGHQRGMARDRSRDRWTLAQPPWWQRRYGAGGVTPH